MPLPPLDYASFTLTLRRCYYYLLRYICFIDATMRCCLALIEDIGRFSPVTPATCYIRLLGAVAASHYAATCLLDAVDTAAATLLRVFLPCCRYAGYFAYAVAAAAYIDFRFRHC